MLEEKETKIIQNPNKKDMEAIGRLLRDGGLVAIPTETVYGLGANGLDAEAMSRIYEAKGRPSDNPLILHVPDIEAVIPLVKEITPTAKALMEAFWPGPLTITLEKSDLVPDKATGGLSRVALRCPNHALCHDILQAAGVPIAAPSANLSGRPSPTTAAGVWHDMKGRIDLIVDAGPCQIGVESTVVECGQDAVTILRPGGITADMLRTVVKEVRYDTALQAGTAAPKAPGMKYKHYAPDAEMIGFVGAVGSVAKRMNEALTQIKAEGLDPYIAGLGFSKLASDTLPDRLMDNSKINNKVNNKQIRISRPLKLGLLVSEEVSLALAKEWQDLGLEKVNIISEGNNLSQSDTYGVLEGAGCQLKSVSYRGLDLVLVVYGKHNKAPALARVFYEALLYFNEEGVQGILAEGLSKDGLGMAVMNRMEKATAHRIIYTNNN